MDRIALLVGSAHQQAAGDLTVEFEVPRFTAAGRANEAAI